MRENFSHISTFDFVPKIHEGRIEYVELIPHDLEPAGNKKISFAIRSEAKSILRIVLFSDGFLD